MTSTTNVLMVADMSGSMHDRADDVRGGFNAYIADLSKDSGNIRLTLTVFDTEVTTLCLDAPLSAVPKLTEHNYNPYGCTALLDAVGKTILAFEKRVPKLNPGDRVLFVLQTDGYENSSKEFSGHMIKNLIEAREAGGQWDFIYLGAGADTWDQAQAMGFSRDTYLNTSDSAKGYRSTYSGLSGATSAYAQGASVLDTMNIVENTPGVTQ